MCLVKSVKKMDMSSFLYGNCSKILNTCLFLFSTKVLVIVAGIHKVLVKMANREVPDQTASSEIG